jgi:hypothetical protein
MAVIKDGGAKTLSVDTEHMLSFDPISFMWGADLKVRLGPFQWQAMRLQVPLPEPTCWQPLQHWFWRWFKENTGEHNEALAGAVYFLSDPEVSDGAVTFAVDLGTAPVEAFEDLLDALEMMGAKRCEIGHPEGSGAPRPSSMTASGQSRRIKQVADTSARPRSRRSGR